MPDVISTPTELVVALHSDHHPLWQAPFPFNIPTSGTATETSKTVLLLATSARRPLKSSIWPAVNHYLFELQYVLQFGSSSLP